MFYRLLLLVVAAMSVAANNEHAEINVETYPRHDTSSRHSSLPILDMLFPNQSIDDAYENYPLLATTSTALSDKQTDDSIPVASIPHDSRDRQERIQSLLPLNSIHSILSQPNMVHGNDFKLVKKVQRDGEEWIGRLPGNSYSADAAIHSVVNDGFSLVIDAMQRRWTAISLFARQLHDEIKCHLVSCNLYLTPKSLLKPVNDDNNGRRSGFESHWDYMDVIVVQISGEKVWTVAKEPLVYLSNQDQKRKPTVQELGNIAYFDDVLLRPGDALYIPRGFVHNASTVVTDETSDVGPSLHLTFGLEHMCDTTFEGLLHHAIHKFAASMDVGDSVALSKQECPQSPHEISWETVLHQSLSEVARRDRCDRPASFENGGIRPCGGLLRRSVPLNNPLQEIFVSKNNSTQEVKSTDVLRAAYVDAVRLFVPAGDVTRLVGFMNQLFASRDLQTSFCFPYMNDASVIICPTVLSSNEKIDQYQHILEKFEKFAVLKAELILESFESYTDIRSRVIWEENHNSLQAIGQDVPKAEMLDEL